MPTGQISGDFTNVLLSRLSPGRLDALRPHLQRVELEVRKIIYEPNRPIRNVYFVETGMISVVSIMNDGAMIEVGTIGKEGMAGTFVLLETDTVPYQHFVQIPGHAYQLDVATLKNEAEQNSTFQKLLFRVHSAFHTQSMQAAACNGLHTVAQRCCRWILMSHDRANSDVFPLTHEFLALMLGTRRASVTDVLRPLQERGWIQSNRGVLTVLNRKELESGSCECYRIISEQQKRLLD